MSFAIQLYKVSDEPNKVSKTLGTPTTYTGTLRDACSVEAPEIMIEDTGLTSGWPTILRHNYAYIDQFHRYYFFAEMPECVRTGLWRIRMTEDVLMSHSLQIRGHRAFVTRQQNVYNAAIDDPLAVATGIMSTHNARPSSTPWSPSTSLSGRRFVIGLSNVIKYRDTDDTESYPAGLGVMYLCGEYIYIREVIRDVLAADLGSDPSSYITDLYMLPFDPASSTKVKAVIFRSGGASEEVTLSSGLTGRIRQVEDFNATHNWEIALPQAFMDLPQSLRNSNYVKMSVYFPPFGSIDIDPAFYCDSTALINKVSLWTNLNVCTGDAQLVLAPKPTAISHFVIGSANCSLQFPYAGGQVTSSAQRLQTIISGMGALGATLIGGAPGGAASMAAGAVRTAGALVAGSMPLFSMSAGSSKGGASGYFTDRPELQVSIRDAVQPDPAFYGRPCNQEMSLSSLTGFTQVGSIHLGISGASKSELDEIENLLANGVIL